MHELSIAQSIVELVEQHVLPADRRAVKEVKVKVGELSGVVPDSLEFCFSAIVTDTPLANARLHIRQIPFTIRCTSCGVLAASPAGLMVCPKCEGTETSVVSGTELNVEAIALEDCVETA